MKAIVTTILSLLLWQFSATAQQYRLGYDSTTSIPEIYSTVDVYVEENRDGKWIRLPESQFRLLSKGCSLTECRVDYFNRDMVYAYGGKLGFDVRVHGKKTQSLLLQLPVLEDIRFNTYTDSIKPIMNYWVNVEGIFSSGRIFPLDSTFVIVTADTGIMQGFEWIPPKAGFDSVTFTAINKYDTTNKKTLTLYRQLWVDPRDAESYEEGGVPAQNKRQVMNRREEMGD